MVVGEEDEEEKGEGEEGEEEVLWEAVKVSSNTDIVQ